MGEVWLKIKLVGNLYNISVYISIIIIKNHFLDAKRPVFIVPAES